MGTPSTSGTVMTCRLTAPKHRIKLLAMTIALTGQDQALIERALETGRWHRPDEVVHAALSRFEREELPLDYPPGSLTHLYTSERNAEERLLNQVTSLRVEHDE